MWHSLTSFVLFIASWLLSVSATSYTYLAENVALAYALLSALCLVFLLLGIVVTVSVHTDGKGKIHSPRSISALACLLLLIPQSGIVLGLFFNYSSSLEIMRSMQEYSGAKVFFDDGYLVLDGGIGRDTLTSLETILEQESSSTLLLRSEGGLIDIGIEIGKIVEKNRMYVIVTESCESACLIIALSGEQLFVAPDARFGFHRGSSVASKSSQIGRFVGNIATEEYLSALAALGIPDSILSITENTPSNEMYYYSGNEIIELKLARDISDYWNLR